MKTATIIAFVISLLIQVGFPLAAALYFRRHFKAPWKVYGYGLLIFAVFQLFTWLPISVYLDATLGSRFNTGWGAFLWLLAVAFFTALIEESGRWLGYRYLFPRHKYMLSWENGIMYGLGHAGMETILLIAGLTFIYFIAYLVLGQLNQGQFLDSLGYVPSNEFNSALAEIANTRWTQPAVVAFERVLMLGHQLAWSVMVLASLLVRRKRWFLFAVIYHWSVAVIVPGLAGLFGFWVAEIANLALCAFSVVVIIKLRALLAEDHLS